jgi:phospholipase C
LDALSLPSPTNDGPTSLELPTISPSEEELLAAHQSPPNNMQQSLAILASNLPAGAAQVQAHSAELAQVRGQIPPPTFQTVEEALARVKLGLNRFLAQPRANA